MNHDELAARLQRLDPARQVSVDPVHGPRADALLEQIMQTTHESATSVPEPARRPRRFLALVGAGAVAVAGAVAFVVVRGGDDAAPTSVRYAMEAPNPAQMCINIDGIQSDPSWIGFRGTVVAVDATSVTLDVASWYRGGTADQVVLALPEGGVALEGGTDFQMGADMLVGVMDGTTLGCGISGPYSADLAARYQTWFG